MQPNGKRLARLRPFVGPWMRMRMSTRREESPQPSDGVRLNPVQSSKVRFGEGEASLKSTEEFAALEAFSVHDICQKARTCPGEVDVILSRCSIRTDMLCLPQIAPSER